MIEVHIAGIPPPPNATRRRHWGKNADEAAIWRRTAYLSALDVLRRSGRADDYPLERADLEYVFLLDRAQGDLDNLVAAAKPLVDGLRDAKILRDDSVGHLQSISASWKRSDQRGVILRIREAP